MKKILTILVLFISSITLYGQKAGLKIQQKWCFVGDSASHPTDGLITRFNPPNSNSILIDPNGVIIIPVVFHILYHVNKPEERVTNLIASQMTRLNADFSKQNSDIGQVPFIWQGLAADMKFQFKLACVDPNGNPTNGINEVPTVNPNPFCQFGGTQNMLCPDAQFSSPCGYGADAWPTEKYLNIWVCDMEPSSQGFAMLPEYRFGTGVYCGNPYPSSRFDGIILDYRVVGENSNGQYHEKGRALTHEVGHWLGLKHVYNANCFGTGDEVGDTPAQSAAMLGCPVFPYTNDACSPGSPGIMFMNYMDQTSDDCRYFFTTGQKDRARSYFSSGGPYGTRFDFIQNYFGIKHFASNPYVVQNNMITVFMNNPACLPVTYNYTGPVTEISHDNQKIIFSVTCGISGTISLTTTSGNYTDNYVFDFVNTVCSAWPKIYESSAETPISVLGKYVCGNPSTGNIYAYVSANMSNNINHSGALPSTPGSYLTHYTSTGATNWLLPNEIVGFILNNGNFQSILPTAGFNNFITVFRDGVTGALTSGPVPSNEVILAEDNGTYITTTGADLRVRWSLNGLSIIPLLPGYLFPYQNKYDPVTKKLFVKYSQVFTGTQSPDAIAVYDLANNTLTLVRTFIPPTLNWSYMLQVNTSDKVFLSSNGNIYKYDYVTNGYSLYSISGLNNNGSIAGIYDGNSYVSDDVMSFNMNDNFIYYINTATDQLKKIQYTAPCSSCMWLSYYKNHSNNDVYLVGLVEGYLATIGSQTYALPGGNVVPIFLAKFNIQTDFTLRSPTESFVSNTETIKTTKSPIQQNKIDQVVANSAFAATLSPNPAKNSLIVNLKQKGNETASLFLISVTNILGIEIFKQSTQQKILIVDLSQFRSGMYYVTISTDKGNRTTQMFMKE